MGKFKLLAVLLAIILGGKIAGEPTLNYHLHITTNMITSQLPEKQSNKTITSSVNMDQVPTPTPVPVVIAASAPSPQGVITSYITQKFGSTANIALCIAYHESGYRADAINYNWNGSIDRGVFQINSIHGYDPSSLFDWKQNIDIAYQMSGGGYDWNPWTTKHYCE